MLVYVLILGEVVVIVLYVVVYFSGLIEMCILICFDGKDIWCDLFLIVNYSDIDKNKFIEVIC